MARSGYPLPSGVDDEANAGYIETAAQFERDDKPAFSLRNILFAAIVLALGSAGRDFLCDGSPGAHQSSAPISAPEQP